VGSEAAVPSKHSAGGVEEVSGEGPEAIRDTVQDCSAEEWQVLREVHADLDAFRQARRWAVEAGQILERVRSHVCDVL
jgi:hypothetical protein